MTARSKPTRTITLNVMGRRQRVPFSGTEEQLADFRKGQRQWMRQRRSELVQVRALIAAATPDAPPTIDNAVAAVHDYSLDSVQTNAWRVSSSCCARRRQQCSGRCCLRSGCIVTTHGIARRSCSR